VAGTCSRSYPVARFSITIAHDFLYRIIIHNFTICKIYKKYLINIGLLLVITDLTIITGCSAVEKTCRPIDISNKYLLLMPLTSVTR
jgi:hypothetical protein